MSLSMTLAEATYAHVDLEHPDITSSCSPKALSLSRLHWKDLTPSNLNLILTAILLVMGVRLGFNVINTQDFLCLLSILLILNMCKRVGEERIDTVSYSLMQQSVLLKNMRKPWRNRSAAIDLTKEKRNKNKYEVKNSSGMSKSKVMKEEKIPKKDGSH
uniref:Uncharacterized protein n=1 Tax=Brassica oleracea var. oleracea TaxID=109376 RepID=A0A0D2ZSE3_BRAOL